VIEISYATEGVSIIDKLGVRLRMILHNIMIYLLLLVLEMAIACEAADVTGAHIRGSAVNAVIYVSPAGSDRNPGTKERPLRTIAGATKVAVAKSDKGIGVRIRIAPGIYRDSVNIQSSPDRPTAPIVYEATKTGTTIVAGTDKWTGGWTKSKESGAYSHQWTPAWGFGPDIWADYAAEAPHASMRPIVRRREIVFVNDVAQKQVLTSAELVPGSFCIQEQRKCILLYPGSGCVPNEADIEVGKRDVLFSVDGRSNISLLGLVFARSSNYVTKGAVRFKRANNIVVENCRVEWNNGDGICLNECNDVTFRNVVSSHNGMSGIIFYQGRNIIFQGLVTDYNNWRGTAGGFDNWATAGLKAFHIHGMALRDYSTRYNATFGLWFDTDNRDIIVERMRSTYNSRAGVLLEASQGPIGIYGSEIMNNERGIYIASSAGVTIVRCRINGNRAPQIAIKGDYLNGRSPDDWETGQTYKILPERCSLLRNTITGESGDRSLIGLGDDPNDWASFDCFLRSLTASGNTYYHPSSDKAFVNSQGHPVDLKEWQKVTRQDKSSVWARPK
jgi:parallel beta-helix repeat protein